jgi:hypothetical protein
MPCLLPVIIIIRWTSTLDHPSTRQEIPIVYAGELKDEQEMLEWLIKNQSSADDDDVIEDTTEEKLEIMVRSCSCVVRQCVVG